MSAKQLIAKIPPDERIADVQVLDVAFDKNTPDVMEVDILIRSYAQQTAVFSLLLGTIEDTASNLAATE